MKHLQYTETDIKITAAGVFWWMGCLMWPGVHAGDSGALRFRPVHEGFDPGCAVYEFCCGYNVLHPAVFHLREETKSSYFCIGHPAQEEHQRCSILPLLACTVVRDACHLNKMQAKLTGKGKYVAWQRTFYVLPLFKFDVGSHRIFANLYNLIQTVYQNQFYNVFVSPCSNIL